MIKIKHQQQLYESEIPIPEKLADYIFDNFIQVPIFNYLLSDLNEHIYEAEKGIKIISQQVKSIKNNNDSSIKLKSDYEKALKDQEDNKFNLKMTYKIIEKIIPSYIYHKLEILNRYNLEHFSQKIYYSDFITSDFKYKEMPNIPNNKKCINIDIYFKKFYHNNTEGSFSYNNGDNILRIYPIIWDKFLIHIKTTSIEWLKNNTFDWDFNLAITKQNTISRIKEMFLNYREVIEHELVHFVQYNFISKADWKKGYVDSNINYGGYLNNQTEFFSWLRGLYVKFKDKYPKNFTNEQFNDFIQHSDYFKNLLASKNMNNYKKAIVQFYMMVKKGILENDKN